MSFIIFFLLFFSNTIVNVLFFLLLKYQLFKILQKTISSLRQFSLLFADVHIIFTIASHCFTKSPPLHWIFKAKSASFL